VNIKFFCLKNQIKEKRIMKPATPVEPRIHLKARGSSNKSIGMFMPNTPATTPKIATTNVAVVSSNSNCISWFRTLSCFERSKDSAESFPEITENPTQYPSKILTKTFISIQFQYKHAMNERPLPTTQTPIIA
jgi:hypothetical protein